MPFGIAFSDSPLISGVRNELARRLGQPPKFLRAASRRYKLPIFKVQNLYIVMRSELSPRQTVRLRWMRMAITTRPSRSRSSCPTTSALCRSASPVSTTSTKHAPTLACSNGSHPGLQACSVAVCAPIKLGLAAPRRQGSYLCVCVLTKCSALFYIHICGHIYVGDFCYGGAVPLVFRYARYAPHSAYLTYLYLGCVSMCCTFTTGI